MCVRVVCSTTNVYTPVRSRVPLAAAVVYDSCVHCPPLWMCVCSVLHTNSTTLASWAITSIRILFAQTISRWLLFCWPTHSFRPLNSYLLFRFFLLLFTFFETHTHSETRDAHFFISFFFSGRISVWNLCGCRTLNIIAWSWMVQKRKRMMKEVGNVLSITKNQYMEKVFCEKVTIFSGGRFTSANEGMMTNERGRKGEEETNSLSH